VTLTLKHTEDLESANHLRAAANAFTLVVIGVDTGIIMAFDLAQDDIQQPQRAATAAIPRQARAPAPRSGTARIPAQRRGAAPRARTYHNRVGNTALVVGMLALAVGLLPYVSMDSYVSQVAHAVLGAYADMLPFVGFLAVVPGATGLLLTVAAVDNLRRRVANNRVGTTLAGLTCLAGLVLPVMFLALAVADTDGAHKADTGLPEFAVCLARATTTEEVNACS
jgi:hypothetical protein